MKTHRKQPDSSDLAALHPPISLMVYRDKCARGGVERHLRADRDQRRALAATYLVSRVLDFEAHFRVEPIAHGLAVTGKVRAQIEQPCCVGLEPVHQRICEPIAERFISPAPGGRALDTHRSARGRGKKIVTDLDPMEDPPMALVDDAIDLGELACEYFALAIDLYPRKPGVSFEPSNI